MGEIGDMEEARRAIGADRLAVAAHVDEHMGMIERGQGADAHEFLGAHLDGGHALRVVEMRSAVVGHVSSLE